MERRTPSRVGELVRRHRIATALSQEALAERAGLSARAISDLERGVHQTPRLESLRLLAAALGLDAAGRAELLAAAYPPAVGHDQQESARHRTSVALPAPPTRLIGREAEVAAVGELLAQHDVRLVTLTGPGGSGKTRVALAVASEVVGRYPDGVWFVDLSPVTDPALVLPTVASVVNTQGVRDGSLREDLSRRLRDRALLLVLDNCEQVLAAAPDIAALLSSCPDLVILATSRMPLHLRGEWEVAVTPLPVPDPGRLPPLEELAHVAAVALFVERGRAARADFALTPDNATAISAICRRLDGLPLALELAAARVKVLPPSMLLARLEKCLPLLTEGRHDVSPRQQTMRETIAWSHDLLSPEEQTLYRRLAVFAGGCTLEAAEAVASLHGPLDVFGGITSLVDQSLLRQEGGVAGEPRFRMLETVREFGLERLATNEEDRAVRGAHGLYYLGLAERWAPTSLGARGLGDRVVRLEVEQDNLRAALEHFAAGEMVDAYVRLAGSLAIFWFVRGQLSEGRRWLDRAVALPGASAAARARALFGAGWVARFQGDGSRALELLDEGFALWRELGDDWGQAQALFLMGTEFLFQGEFDRAESTLTEALTQYQTHDNEAEAAITLDQLGVLAGFRGDVDRSSALLEDALRIQQQLGDAFGAAYSLSNLATFVHLPRCEVAKAARRLRESLELNRAIGQVTQLAWCFHALAHAALDEHPVPAARLLGAEAAVRAATGVVVPPAEQILHQRFVDLVRGRLTPSEFNAAWATGAALTLDDAVAEALALAAELAQGSRS